jgi:hypothetical protein
MDKRYQVFVSSTYVDLIPERSEVMQALLELKCMPAGMELFPAANETQWNWIKKVIDESDYYIVIFAGRYGSTSKETGQSYTEMEYRYALETGKPAIGFLHEDITKIQSKFVEQSATTRRKLDAFRALVSSRLCKKYSTASDLGAKVSRSLTQLREQCPATGWIRADLAPSSERIDEILKLKEENERLTEHIYRLGLQEPDTLSLLASGSELFEIEYFFDRMEENPETGRFRRSDTHMESVKISWDEIFSVIGPSLIEGDEYWSIADALLPQIERRTYPHLHRRWPTAKFQRFRIATQDTDAILLQLRALKLIALKEDGKWGLTPYGDNYMAKLLAVPKGQGKRQ